MYTKLKKTIKVDNEEYEICAAEADKVKNKLIIKQSNLGKDSYKETSYDGGGTADTEVFIVSANTGGRFNDKIRVPKNTETNINGEAVLNYSDIKNVLVKELTNTSALYEWNGEYISPTAIDKNNLRSISLIKGKAEDVESFARKNFNEKLLSGFIYLCVSNSEEPGSLYFGSYDSPEVFNLTVEAKSALEAGVAARLKTKRVIKTNLGSDLGASFDGTQDVNPGVYGTLPAKYGGTGQTSLSAVKGVGSALNVTTKINNDNISDIFKITNGHITAAKSATKVTDSIVSNNTEYAINDIFEYAAGPNTLAAKFANTATKAAQIQTKTGSTANGYNTIFLGSAQPVRPSKNDIWIKY